MYIIFLVNFLLFNLYNMLLSLILWILWIALSVWMVLCRWKIFKKSWFPWRGILVPFYNIYLILKLSNKSGRWLLSMLFPPLFLIIMIICAFKIAKKFDRSWWFALGLLVLHPIFVWFLAFDIKFNFKSNLDSDKTLLLYLTVFLVICILWAIL